MTPTLCPRCRGAEPQAVARSPLPGRWIMYSCATCRYAWRSTETPEFIDPDLYPPDFRLRATEIQSAERMI